MEKTETIQITVFGATGTVGKQMVQTALAHGFKVVAFGRTMADYVLKQPIHANQLVLQQGYVFDLNDVKKAVNGSQAVFSALGGGITEADKTRSLGMKYITEAMQSEGVKRIIAIGGLGVLPDTEFERMVHNPAYPKAFKAVGLEHVKAFEYLRQSALHYSFICAPNIVDTEPASPFSFAVNQLPAINKGEIDAVNLAEFCVHELYNVATYQQLIGISNQ